MNGVLPRAMCGLLLLAGVSGCGAGSGIIAIGPDTYTVSEMRAPALGGGPEARRAVLAEAGAFCRRQSRTALTLALAPDGDPYTPFYPTAFDATFRCVRVATP